VSSNNLLVLFLGWEGVGLCSYLLIGFWYTRAQAGKSATKAFLINKIGDLFLLSGISFIFSIFHTIEFSSLSGLLSYCPNYVLDTAALLFFFGAVGKSAQVGLHTWLPDAMEGPTPVSALIHAATMVTAGVFLVIRCSFIFEYTPKILDLISFWGGITALISGSIGTVQNDIKKIIAYSTCSQLGYMIVACGISVYNISLFHLFNHAFFKALLFLSAGSIIHILGDEQDIRKMGGFSSLSPFIYIAMTVASLALAGFPFLSGYYSKDLIIESTISKLWTSQQSIYYLIIISTAFTASYSLRLAEQVFWVDFNGFKSKIYMRASTTIIELLVLLFLAILSIISGYIFRDLFLGFGNSYLADFITKYISTWDLVETEFLNNKIKVIPLILALITVEFESRFLECKWLYNELVNGYLALPTLILSRQYFEQYDKRILELNGPSLLLEFSYSTFTGSKN
jgi:proton-translocating NADH-quinone oxidoreductase chain L